MVVVSNLDFECKEHRVLVIGYLSRYKLLSSLVRHIRQMNPKQVAQRVGTSRPTIISIDYLTQSEKKLVRNISSKYIIWILTTQGV